MFDQMQGFIWMDGQLYSWSDAKCHVMTHALHYASSVYEGLRAYNGKILSVEEHYKRLHQSANYLDFEIPYSVDELIDATKLVLKNGTYKEAYIRAISWCGSKVMTVSHRNADVHTAIAVWERPLKYPKNFYTQGIRMNISEWRRPEPRTAPVHSKASGLYMISSMSKKASELMGFDDALMLDCQDNIAEATSSNIFFVIDGSLYTPPPTCFLNGITRLTCMKLAIELGIEVNEKVLTLKDLSKATEVFLTGTAIEILPVGSIEYSNNLYSFTPGAITKMMMRSFQDMKSQLS